MRMVGTLVFHVCTTNKRHSPGVRLQLKLLESALSSLLQCQTALCHYQPCHEHETQPVESQQETKEEVEDGRRSEERPESGGDALTSLLLTRLLAVLKQLVSTAMKKRY